MGERFSILKNKKSPPPLLSIAQIGHIFKGRVLSPKFEGEQKPALGPQNQVLQIPGDELLICEAPLTLLTEGSAPPASTQSSYSPPARRRVTNRHED